MKEETKSNKVEILTYSLYEKFSHLFPNVNKKDKTNKKSEKKKINKIISSQVKKN